MQPELNADVIVIGAGIAGIAVARRVIAAGRSVIVLEADKRIGGRLRTRRLPDGTCYDLGGQWIGTEEDMPRVHALIKEYGLTLFHQVDSGRLDMTAHPLMSMDRLTQAEWEWFKAKLADLAETIDVANPSRSPNAVKLDSISVEEWKRRNLESQYLRHMFDQVVRTEYTIEPKDFSFLHFLSTVKMNGGLDAMFNSSHSYRLVEGFQTLVEKMAAPLGDRLRLESQVYDIAHGQGGVRVVAEGAILTGKRVVVAIPPNQAQRIDFEPMLPRSRMWLIQRMEMGSVIKCFALYQRPFWRGRSMPDIDPDDLIFDHTLDASSHDNKHYALVAFIGGSDAVYWSDQTVDARKRAVLEGLARVFGDEALYPSAYFDHDWLTEPFIGGGYNCYAPPGVITAGYESIDEPIGRIHFAGTETAQHFEGYIEGALESAERAAKEILAALSQED
jgi:monoamine oxidase